MIRNARCIDEQRRNFVVRLGLWSADYTPLTGQALVTARVVRHQDTVSWREYVYSGAGLRMISTWAGAGLRLWRDIVLGRVRTLYLVCSRSNGGFLRDVPALLAARVGLRVIVHVHGSDIVDLLSARRLSPLARALYARCEIVVPSAHLLEPLREVTSARLHLCENFFFGDFPVSTAGATPPDPATLTVFWNSNVMASKGFFDLSGAVRQVSEEGLDVRLIAIGRPLGDEEMSLEEATQRLEELRNCDWFHYHGPADQATTMALTAYADVVCLPSRYSSECQPLAVIQAMCMGKAVIVSDTPALRATLGGYPARFVSVRSSDAIVEVLRQMLRQKQADPSAFAAGRQEATSVARTRFATARFDEEMATILSA